MPPCGLTALPEEILLYVVESACEGEPRKKIYQLLFVNRRISRLALPFLYRNLGDGDFVDDDNDDHDGFRKLVLTLLFDPTKAVFVHSFSLNHCDVFGEGPRLTDEGVDAELEAYWFTAEQHGELQGVVDILMDYDDSETKESWKVDFLEPPLMGAILALMLARLPSLYELTILDADHDYWDAFEYVVNAMIAASNDPKSGVMAPFPKLEKVNMGGSTPESPHSTRPLTIIARWPCVKVIDGTKIGDGDTFYQEDPDKWFLDLVPKSTNYTSLSFRPSSKLLSEHLVRFLGTAKALESFDYHIGHAWAWIPLSTPELSRALDQHKETLKSITLQIFVTETGDRDSTFAPMRFNEYPALTQLNIAFRLLFGFAGYGSPPDATVAQNHLADALPESLETLEIVQCDNQERVIATTTAVGAVLRLKKERWTKLRKVVVAGEDAGWDVLEKMQEELQEEGEKHGVKYTATRCRQCYENGLEIDPPIP